MKRRMIGSIGLAVVVVLGVSAAALATGQHVVKGKVTTSNRAGSKAAPAPFASTYDYTLTDSAGQRVQPPKTWRWKWSGVTAHGADFPKCTAGQIDAAQSDSVCPKGSLISEGPLTAVLGPTNDRTSQIFCKGKIGRIYNAGASAATYYITGPGDQCAGVGYLAPTAMTLKTSGGSTEFTLPFPENITHPIPGIDGALSTTRQVGKVLTATVKGKKESYLQSTSCPGGRRTFTYTIVDPEGTHVAKTDMGRCTR